MAYMVKNRWDAKIDHDCLDCHGSGKVTLLTSTASCKCAEPPLEGPYPNKAREFCGNHLPGKMIWASHNQSPEAAEYNQKQWLSKMRFGKPRPCEAGTVQEMEDKGYVGLYLKKDDNWPLARNETEVPTPVELTEPV